MTPTRTKCRLIARRRRGRPMTATQDDMIAELQRTIAELRRERDVARPAQQRIRRADRASVRDDRRAEGDVGLAGRSAAGVRSDRSPCAGTVQQQGGWHCSNSMANWSTSARTTAPETYARAHAQPTSRRFLWRRRADRSPAGRFWTGRSFTSAIRTRTRSLLPAVRDLGDKVAAIDPTAARRRGDRRVRDQL